MKVIEVKQPGGLDNLNISERKNPKPDRGEIAVRWHATSLNYHDYLVAVGGIPVADQRIPMSDGAGEVIQVGEDVNEWKKGDKVMSMFFPGWTEGRPTLRKTVGVMGETLDGCMAEWTCVTPSGVSAIPDGYSYAEAASLPCAALTAWRGLIEEGRLNIGQSVLVEGTGGVSIFALQIAKAAGAKVFATTSSEEKAERMKAMGADEVINYKEDEKWGKTIFKLSGRGVDHVIDVGGGSTMRQSIEAVAIGGHISSIGILSGGRKGEITFPKLFFKHIRLQGIAVGSREMQQNLVDSINISGWKPVIDKSFAFDQLGDAFSYQESGRHFGKIVLEW